MMGLATVNSTYEFPVRVRAAEAEARGIRLMKSVNQQQTATGNCLSLEQMVDQQMRDESRFRVSVIITCHNQESWIGDAIESATEQITDFPYQILVGDDASVDRSGEILKQYEQTYPDKIFVISHANNIGVTANRTDLFYRCMTPYVAMLDGDDYWADPHQLQRKYNFMEKQSCYIAYFTGGCRWTNGILDSMTDFERRDCFHSFTKEDSLCNAYPGIQDGFFFRNIFKYQPESFTRYFAEVPVDYSSKLPILLGMIGDVFRDDHTMTYVYRDLEGTESKKETGLVYYRSRIALQEMIRELFGEEMQVRDQMEGLVWDAFVAAVRSIGRGGTEREQFRAIWNDGYFSKPEICRILAAGCLRRALHGSRSQV